MERVEDKYQYNQKITTKGGGGGQYVLLRGLSRLNNPTLNTALYSVWDDGSKSGETRTKYGVVGPGDYFMCLYGLMESDEQVKVALALLNDRSQQMMLRDMLAVQGQRRYHSLEAATNALRTLLRIQGNLFPVSSMDLHLQAETKNGNVIKGETNIDKREDDKDFDPADVTRTIFFDIEADATDSAKNSILTADKVVEAPGSPYTSIFPHNLVHGIPEVTMASHATLIPVPNLTTARGEDHHLNRVSLWLQEYQFLIGDQRRIEAGFNSRINYLVVNSDPIPKDTQAIYSDKGQMIVELDEEECMRLAPGLQIIKTSLLDQEELAKRLIRHDSFKLAKAILELPPNIRI